MLTLVVLGAMAGCKNPRESQATSIIFPDSLTLLEQGRQTQVATHDFIGKAKATIICPIYGDCHVCVHKMNSWNELLRKGKFPNIQLIFIIRATHLELFLKTLYPMVEYSGPLVIDSKDEFYSLNKLTNATLEDNTFLLDSDFKVVLSGDPITLPELLSDYETVCESLNSNR